MPEFQKRDSTIRCWGTKSRLWGGRGEVEKEIATLQNAEKQGELDKLNGFIFDLDRTALSVNSSQWVHVLQWDRYSSKIT